MTRAGRSLPLLVLACACLPVCAAAAAPTRETLTASSRQQAEDRDHPASHLLPVVVTRPFHGGARVCGYYENDIYQLPATGRAKLDVGLWRAGARIALIEFKSRRVPTNHLDFGCRDAPRLRAGDTLLFDFRFSDMPRLEPRPFSHGFIVNTSMVVSARVEPPRPKEPSTIELLSVEPAFGSRIPAGGKIRVRIGYTCNRPLGCNVAAGFEVNGRAEEVVRGVARGSRSRYLVMRCRDTGRSNLVKSGLILQIESSEASVGPLDAKFINRGFTCLSDNPWPGAG